MGQALHGLQSKRSQGLKSVELQYTGRPILPISAAAAPPLRGALDGPHHGPDRGTCPKGPGKGPLGRVPFL